MEFDDRVGDALERLEPSFATMPRDWDDVVARAGRMHAGRRGRGARLTARVRRLGVGRSLLIAAAVCALGVGVAGATGGLGNLFAGANSGRTLFHRHYPVRQVVVSVHYDHGLASPAMRQRIGDGSAWRLPRYSHEILAGNATRTLVDVSFEDARYRFFATPMKGQRGYCVFGATAKPRIIEPGQFCTHSAAFATPWVNQPPPFSQHIPHRIGGWAIDGNHSSLLAKVSGPLDGWNGVRPRPYGARRRQDGVIVPVWTVTGMAPRGAARFDIRFQDGTTMPASTNGRFFIAVIDGAHTRVGHRPIAVAALSAGGAIVARQRLNPEAFDAEQYAVAQAVQFDHFSVDEVAVNETQVITGRLNTPFRLAITTGAKVARVFGGQASSYPKVAAVIVYDDGPYRVPVARHNCPTWPAQCTLAAGTYAWLALVMPAGVALGAPGNGLKRAERLWEREIRWVRLAPPHTPAPKLAPLGPWRWNEGSRRCGQSGFCQTDSP
jgi:hypothetical protein